LRLFLTNFFRKAIGFIFNSLVYIFPQKIGQWSFDVFAKPRDGKVTAAQSEFLKSASAHSFHIDNSSYTTGSVHVQVYEWKNSGPTLLLIHGWESNSARWEPLITRLLAQQYHIIALDAPGHGNSGALEFNIPLHADMMKLVADRWNIKAIVAHSLGASTTCYFINKYQLPINGCILLAPPQNLQSTTNLYHEYLSLSQKSGAALQAHFKRRIGESISDFDYIKYVQQFNFPGLILHSSDDDIVDVQDGININEHWEQAECSIYEDAGHSLQTEVIYERILGWLKVWVS